MDDSLPPTRSDLDTYVSQHQEFSFDRATHFARWWNDSVTSLHLPVPEHKLSTSRVQPLSQGDLLAYLKRLGLNGAVISGAAPSVALLRSIMQAHVVRIPFDNSHVYLLSAPVGLGRSQLIADLVDSPRGGYCFQHNTLLASALLALGFVVSTGVARGMVWDACSAEWGVAGPTHMVIFVSIPDAPHLWLADVGLPFPLIEPMPIVDAALVPGPAGEAHRIVATTLEGLGDGFALHHRRAPNFPPAPGADPASGFAPIHFFTMQTFRPQDYEVLNFYSNFSPFHRSHQTLTLSRVSESGGHWTLVDRVFRQREVPPSDCKCGSANNAGTAGGRLVTHDVSAFACQATETRTDIDTLEQLRQACWQHFGVDLSSAELESARCKLFASSSQK